MEKRRALSLLLLLDKPDTEILNIILLLNQFENTLLLTQLLFEEDNTPLIVVITLIFMYPSPGNGRKVSQNSSLPIHDVYQEFKNLPALFQRMIRMDIEEFNTLLNECLPFILQPRNTRAEYTHEENLARRHKKCKLSVENRFLLVLYWLSHYPTYTALSYTFGIDKSMITEVSYFSIQY